MKNNGVEVSTLPRFRLPGRFVVRWDASGARRLIYGEKREKEGIYLHKTSRMSLLVLGSNDCLPSAGDRKNKYQAILYGESRSCLKTVFRFLSSALIVVDACFEVEETIRQSIKIRPNSFSYLHWQLC